MSPTEPPAASERAQQSGSWSASGSLLAGVLVYGFVGWLADRWLGTSFLVAVGVLVGACLGTYLMVHRLTRTNDPPDDPPDDQ